MLTATVSVPSVRALVLAVLEGCRNGQRFAEDLLDEELGGVALEPRDRGLARELTLGVVRHQLTLDAIAAAFCKRPLAEVDPAVLDALRLGAYQIVFLERIPAFAAVDQTVEALRARGKPQAVGFANGVLRALLRDLKGRVDAPADPRRDIPVGPGRWVRFGKPVLPPAHPVAEHLVAAYSYPPALVRRWLQAFGRPRADEIMLAGNQSPPVVLRANRLRIDRDGLVARMVSDGIAARPGAHPSAVVLDKPGRPLGSMPAFAEGLATAQDATAIGVGEAVEPPPGGKVLDLCASPGGKSTHLAELMGNSGVVLASDVSEDKLVPVAENAARLGLTIIRTCRTEELDARAREVGPFDRVLVDVPCSNTGVLSRRAEARWRARPEDIAALAARQLALLRQGAGYAAPGGRLVYSTCSIEPEENEGVVTAFLAGQTDLRLLDDQTTLPDAGANAADWRDGGFRARLERRR